MSNFSLKNKKVLVVDDEPDVLESLEELLYMCDVVKADSFEKAAEFLENTEFDFAVLDIMGVDGYELLEKAHKKDIITVMLTANALSPDNIKKSYQGGACSYVPKEEMINIEEYLIDVLKAQEEGKNPWLNWYQKLGNFCERKFGPDWQNGDKEFWNKMMYY